MKFLKQDLDGYYDWKPEGEKSVYDGDATRRLFDRCNGNQVLFLINVFLHYSGNASLISGKYAERLIIEQLPLDKRSEISVLNWLRQQTASGQLIN